MRILVWPLDLFRRSIIKLDRVLLHLLRMPAARFVLALFMLPGGMLLGFWLGCFDLALAYRLWNGEWPTYGHPDPGRLGWRGEIAMDVTMPLGLIKGIFLGFALWFASTRRTTAAFALVCNAAILPAGLFLAAMGLCRWDPFGVVDWTMD